MGVRESLEFLKERLENASRVNEMLYQKIDYMKERLKEDSAILTHAKEKYQFSQKAYAQIATVDSQPSSVQWLIAGGFITIPVIYRMRLDIPTEGSVVMYADTKLDDGDFMSYAEEDEMSVQANWGLMIDDDIPENILSSYRLAVEARELQRV
jgi:hypothetical protein